MCAVEALWLCAFGCDHVGNRGIELDQAFDCCAAK
jgi:hypothetical protein